MNGLGPLVFVAVLFGLFARIASVAKRQKAASRELRDAADPDVPSPLLGGLLGEMLKEVEAARRRQAMETPAPPLKPGVPARRTRPAALRPGRAAAVAVESIRPTREVVDYDAEAAGLVASRTAAAELTAEGRPAGAHQAFETRIRGVGAPAAPRTHPLGRLRTAMIWREILGPPVSLQPPTE